MAEREMLTGGALSFSNILWQTENEKLYTPYIPDQRPEEMPAAYRPLGLPRDPMSNFPPPGLESPMLNYDTSMPALSGLDGIWDKITQSSESAIDWAYTGIEHAIKGSYAKIKEGVSEVSNDITEPLAASLKTTYMYLLVGVAVLGVALYYVGKGGAVKVRV